MDRLQGSLGFPKRHPNRNSKVSQSGIACWILTNSIPILAIFLIQLNLPPLCSTHLSMELTRGHISLRASEANIKSSSILRIDEYEGYIGVVRLNNICVFCLPHRNRYNNSRQFL